MGTAFTVLSTSAKLGASQLTKLLIDFGADVNAMDSLGRTPLFYAVYFSSEAAVKDMYANDKNNLQRYMETIRVLLANGALVDVKDVNDESPLSLLDTMKVPESIKALFPADVHLQNPTKDGNDDAPPER
jgi:ankyrin repeat protein